MSDSQKGLEAVQSLADELKETLDDPLLTFVASFTLPLPEKEYSAEKEKQTETEAEFMASTLESVKKARELMESANYQYKRPPDMFAEMFKSEKQMDAIREKLEEEEQNIQKAIARRKQRAAEQENKKNQKKTKKPGLAMKPKKKTFKEIQMKRQRRQSAE